MTRLMVAIVLGCAAVAADAAMVVCTKADGTKYAGFDPPPDCELKPKDAARLEALEKASREDHDPRDAIPQCQADVSARLKAPSTASWQDAKQVEVQGVGGGKYRMISWVDANNPMGNIGRVDWWCNAQYLGSGKWEVEVEARNRTD